MIKSAKTYIIRKGGMAFLPSMLSEHNVLNSMDTKPCYSFVKRVFDIIASLFGMIVLIPVAVIVGLAIKIDDGGPIFFIQERLTKNGKPFRLIKFRSMIVNAESLRDSLESENEMDGPVFKIKNDKRITRVGRFIRKTSIDELPQIINVLKGDISIVGPRPPLRREVEQYDEKAMRRLEVKGGLTCLWQIQPHRNALTFDEWMDLDIKYIETRSLILDLIIILKTFKVLIIGGGSRRFKSTPSDSRIQDIICMPFFEEFSKSISKGRANI